MITIIGITGGCLFLVALAVALIKLALAGFFSSGPEEDQDKLW